ncbi:MAG: hypothetical protein LBM02_02445 [Lachnospiraceae bacterium]|jgi:hypothetical protein|nr:hypothetical protein [Lachnospiraceae bacterium]
MADTLSTISTVVYVLAIIALIMAVIFWFAFRIKDVIAILSGKAKRQSIEEFRKESEKHVYQSAYANYMNQKTKKDSAVTSGLFHLNSGVRGNKNYIPRNDKETELLNGGYTKDDAQDTVILNQKSFDGVNRQHVENNNKNNKPKKPPVNVQIIQDEVEVHTDERI